MSPDDPYGETTIEGYDRLAENADSLREGPWGDSDYQRHYVWPAVRPLLPDLSDARVLDAGCGTGEYAERFLERGASVVGVDASEAAVAAARDRVGDRATVRVANLTEPLSSDDASTDGTFTDDVSSDDASADDVSSDDAFADDASSDDVFAEDSFDLVFCNLVLDHVRNWDPVFAEFERLLRADGRLVFTTIHPMRRYRYHREELTSYYEVEAYVSEWDDTGAEIASYHRPIAAVLHPLVRNGFSLERFREATPQERYETVAPDRYELATERPDLLCVRAKSSDGG